jgi:outer membrane protein TolC
MMLMKPNKMRFSLFFFVVMAFHQTPFTQNLSLKEAIDLALERNYQIQISERQIEIAERNNTWSEAGLFPTISLNATMNNVIQDNRNNPFTFTPGLIFQQSIQPSINLNWNVFSGFFVKMNKQRLDYLEQQSRGNALLIVENTVLEVIKVYYTAVLQKSKLILLKKLLGFSKERIERIEVKQQYGSSNSLELMQFKNQYLSDSINVLMQEMSYENSLRNLSLLLNFELDTLFNPTDPLDFNLPLVDYDVLRLSLYENNRNIQNQYINLSLAETNTKLQESFLYPVLAVQAGYQYSRSSFRDLESDLNASFAVPNYFAGATLRYNLYNNWKSKRAVEVAKVQEEIASMNIEDLKRNVKNNTETLIRMYDMRAKLIALSSENLQYAQKVYEMALERFNLGSINSFDLLNVRNQYVQTELTHLDNLYARVEAFYELYRLAGMLGLEISK